MYVYTKNIIVSCLFARTEVHCFIASLLCLFNVSNDLCHALYRVVGVLSSDHPNKYTTVSRETDNTPKRQCPVTGKNIRGESVPLSQKQVVNRRWYLWLQPTVTSNNSRRVVLVLRQSIMESHLFQDVTYTAWGNVLGSRSLSSETVKKGTSLTE